MAGTPEVLHISTLQSGRVSIIPPASSPYRVVLGFHGYAESAETQLARLQSIPATGETLYAAPLALHRFYDRQQNVVGSWLTSQDREELSRANIRYVDRALRRLHEQFGRWERLVLVGYSQGASMAYRMAAYGRFSPDQVITMGGDLPPELRAETAFRSCPASFLLIRGRSDHFLTAERFEADQRLIAGSGRPVTVFEPDSGHEWSAAIAPRIGEFLR